jgi:PPM family protein phosphatase
MRRSSEGPSGGRRTLSAAGVSDRGRIRLDNEDRFYVDVERGIYLVADGVGGHVAGEVAATIACDVIVRRLERPTGTAEQRVREAITLANNEIVRQAATSPAYAGMTCVVTLALVDDDSLTIGHVGDSRLYLLTRQGITKLTHDHSPIGEREDAQEISEVDAMRHPRRNEVFRDVGSRLRDPDDSDFMEVISTRFDQDSAMLLCSDGLSDMLATTVIERTVRQRAGDPGIVAQALVDAANDAGGTDNVTAVYVEGPRFAARQKPFADDSSSLASSSTSYAGRLSWLAMGIVVGFAAASWIPYLQTLDIPLLPRHPRTLVVGAADPARFSTIGEALQVARPGDVVRLEPGDYPERVLLPDGVDLVAAEPGTAVLVAPRSRPDWVALTVHGGRGSRVSGLRVRGQPEAPMTVGIRLAGDNIVIEDVAIEGTIQVGVDVEGEGGILIRGCRFSEVVGTPLRIAAAARPVLRQNLFVRPAAFAEASASAKATAEKTAVKAGAEPLVAIEMAAKAAPELVDNLFVGYTERVRDSSESWTPAQLEQLFRGNYRIRAGDFSH